MPLYLPPFYYQASFVHTQGVPGQTMVCTLGLRCTDENFDGCANGVGNAWLNHVVPMINESWTFDKVSWREQAGVIKEQQFNTIGGTDEAGAPPQVSVIINKITGRPGRKHRGRMYISGIRAQDVDPAGRLTAPAKVSWALNLDLFYQGCIAMLMEPVILHNVAALPGGVGDLPTNITGFDCQQTVGTQRRRLR